MWYTIIAWVFSIVLATGLIAGVPIKWPGSILVYIGMVGLGSIIGLIFSKIYERKEK